MRIKGTFFSDPVVVAKAFELLVDPESARHQEVMWVFCLDSRNKVISAKCIGLGTLDRVSVDCRTTYRTAIVEGAKSIILCHSHPSGQPEPSPADLAITRALAQAGEIVGIELKDHIIVGIRDEGEPLRFCSLREQGRI